MHTYTCIHIYIYIYTHTRTEKKNGEDLGDAAGFQEGNTPTQPTELWQEGVDASHPDQRELYSLSLSHSHTHTHIGVDATQRDELMDEILSEFQGGHDSGRDSSLTVSDFTSSAGLFLFLF